MKVICLSGWKQSGKDTLAGHLIEKFGAVRTSFADPLKDMVADQYGIDRTSLDDPSRKESPILTMPVNPQDAYSRMVAQFLIKELRNAKGKQPESYSDHYQLGFQGRFSEVLETVYWTPRALAILEGSTKRSVTSKYWVQRAINSMKDKNVDLHVISDLRYKSEMQQLRDAFGSDVVFVRVNRFETSPSSDPSERDLDDATFDYYVNNKSSKEEAFSRIEEILSFVIKQAFSA